MILNGVMAVLLRYFTEFGKHAFQHITVSICSGIYARLLYFVVRARCRKESSRSLSHLLMSFLSYILKNAVYKISTEARIQHHNRFLLKLIIVSKFPC